jgi:hypothetical protein
VAVSTAAGSVIIVLDNDGLLAGKPAREQNYDLARLQINKRRINKVSFPLVNLNLLFNSIISKLQAA